MNLKKIQAFVLVIEKGSFSETADIMGLSQPAVSQQIKSLEEDLGVALLVRPSSIVEPTAAGRYVYKMGTQLIRSWRELEQGINTFRGTLSGTIKVGASTIPGTYLVPRWFRPLYHEYPNVNIAMETADSQNVLSRLRYQQVDLGIIGVKPTSPELHVEKVAEDSLVLIAKPDHPILSSPIGDFPEKLLQYDFLLRENGSGTRASMEEWLAHFRIRISDLRTIGQFANTEAIITAVEDGLGLGFASGMAAYPAEKAGRISIVPIMPKMVRAFYLCFLKEREHHPLIKNFVDVIRSYDTQHISTP
jgi:DNA-binding transcriptional LysR family regulator